MPLARGTAAVGYTTMLCLFWAAGTPVTAHIPKDYQVGACWDTGRQGRSWGAACCSLVLVCTRLAVPPALLSRFAALP